MAEQPPQNAPNTVLEESGAMAQDSQPDQPAVPPPPTPAQQPPEEQSYQTQAQAEQTSLQGDTLMAEAAV